MGPGGGDPKLDTILKDAESQRKEAFRGRRFDPDRAEAFQRNVDQLELTQAAPRYIEYLKVWPRVLSRAIWLRKTFVWLPTHGVRLTSLETADLIRRGSEAFGALMTLELPPLRDLKARNSVNGSRASNAGWPNRQ